MVFTAIPKRTQIPTITKSMKNNIVLIRKTDEDTSYAYEERYRQDENQFFHDISNGHITL